MTLIKSNTPVLFSGGLDQKRPEKLSIPGRFLALVNCIRRKYGQIEKRFGFAALGKDVINSGIEITTGTNLANFRENVLLFTDFELFSYSSASDDWIYKSDVVNNTLTTTPVIRNGAIQAMPDMATNGGLTATVWEDSRGGIGCSIIDDVTGTLILSDTQLDLVGKRPKVYAVKGNFIFAYITGTSLVTRKVSVANPATIGAQVVVQGGVVADKPWDVDSIGDYAVFVFNNTSSGLTVGYIDANGVVGSLAGNAFPDPVTIASGTTLGSDCTSIYVNPESGIIYLFYHDAATSTNLRIHGLTGDLVTQNVQTVEAIANVRNVTAAEVDGLIYIFYEISAALPKNHFVKARRAVSWMGIGAITFYDAADVFVRSVGLVTKAFVYNGDVYVSTTHESGLQPTYFVLRYDGALIVTKMAAEFGGGLTRDATRTLKSGLCRVSFTSDSYIGAIQLRNALQTEAGGTVLSTQIGLNRFNIAFAADAFGTATLGENMGIAGGIVQAYDGVSVNELNFNVYPEDIDSASSGANESTRFTFSQTGTFYDVVGAAKAIQLFNAPAVGHYFYITVTGGVNVQTNPGLTGTGHAVAVVPGDTSAQVATKMNTAINLVAAAFTSTNTVASQIVVTNVTQGAATDATATGSAAAVTIVTQGSNGGFLTGGTYAFQVVYEWVDGRGQIHQSAPSVIKTQAALAGQKIQVTIPTLRLTEKPTVVNCVVYVAAVGLSVVYYRSGVVENDASVDTVVYDLAIDPSPTAAVLYTVGGIIDNQAPPAAGVIHQHKNRFFIADLEDGTLRYSKESVVQAGMAFSDLFAIPMEAEGGRVRGLATLDSNLIIMKRDRLYYLPGDGPLDSGAQNDYPRPVPIASDVGTENPNSIAETPVGIFFKSAKGIYLLGRNLVTKYIGEGVEDYNSLTITSAVVLVDENEVRFTTMDGPTLVYNYLFSQWSTFENYEAVSAVRGLDSYLHLKADGTVNRETAGEYLDNGSKFSMAIETSWLAMAGIQGFQRIYRILMLGDFVSHHFSKLKVAYDYENSYTETVYFDTRTGLVSENTYGSGSPYGLGNDEVAFGGEGSSVYQFRFRPGRQKCEAIKVRLEDIDTIALEGGGSFKLVAMNLEVGRKSGAYRLPQRKTIGNA